MKRARDAEFQAAAGASRQLQIHMTVLPGLLREADAGAEEADGKAGASADGLFEEGVEDWEGRLRGDALGGGAGEV